jgi:hypothetical protein
MIADFLNARMARHLARQCERSDCRQAARTLRALATAFDAHRGHRRTRPAGRCRAGVGRP